MADRRSRVLSWRSMISRGRANMIADCDCMVMVAL